jgi:hypothetical protein
VIRHGFDHPLHHVLVDHRQQTNSPIEYLISQMLSYTCSALISSRDF